VASAVIPRFYTLWRLRRHQLRLRCSGQDGRRVIDGEVVGIHEQLSRLDLPKGTRVWESIKDGPADTFYPSTSQLLPRIG
jgi:hypothetical protein